MGVVGSPRLQTCCCRQLIIHHGVTTIPNAIASELVDIVAEFVAAEEIVLDHLNSESPTVKGFAEARKAYKAVVDELTARVRK